MENQPLVDGLNQDPGTRERAGSSLLQWRRQYMEMPFPEVIEEPGSRGLLEYLQILQRRRGTLILIGVLGLVTSLLFTLPQTPTYQTRASIEIQNLNENFLNTRNLSPTAEDGASYAPGSDLRTQAKLLKSESLLDRVAA